MPAHHAAVIDGQGRVGNNKVLIDTNNLAEALTLRTGTYGRIEGEKVVGRFLESNAVSLETHREVVADIRWQEHQATLAMPLVESRLGRVNQSRDGILGIVDRKTVDDEIESLPLPLQREG